MNQINNTLLKKARRLDEAALAEICQDYYERIYRFIYYRVRTKEDAEDLTNEVFIRMVSNIRNQNGNFDAWIYTIARNIITDYYRKVEYNRNVPWENINEGAILETETIDWTDKIIEEEILKEKMALLPIPYQDIIAWRFFNEFSFKEISVLSNRSVTAVKTHAHRAVKTLKALMENQNE